MLLGKKIVVILPAYNAERTLRQTVAEIDRTIVDEIILVDDCSSDQTVKVARELGCGYTVIKKTWGTAATKRPVMPKPSNYRPIL